MGMNQVKTDFNMGEPGSVDPTGPVRLNLFTYQIR